MLPRLEAERELTAINVTAFAMGGVPRNDRQRHVARLERLVRGEAPAPATPGVLAAMGVMVVTVPAEESAVG